MSSRRSRSPEDRHRHSRRDRDLDHTEEEARYHSRSRGADESRRRGPHDDEDREERRRRKNRKERGDEVGAGAGSGGEEDMEEKESKRPKTIESLAQVGVKEITMDDYFLKANEFRTWLREEKHKYMDQMSGKEARRYFRKFLSRWNDCTLPVQFYTTQSATSVSAASQTAYKWSFANNRSRVDKDQLKRLREDVDRMTNGVGAGSRSGGGGGVGPSLPTSTAGTGTSRRVVGPSLPPPPTSSSSSHTDRQLAYESSREDLAFERKQERARAYSRADELVPKSGAGREGRIEEKRATNAINREFREKEMGAGLEVDESTLMGQGGDFGSALAAQKAAEARRTDRNARIQEERRPGAASGAGAGNDRFSDMKSKDAATMAMFKQMAQAKFGGNA